MRTASSISPLRSLGCKTSTTGYYSDDGYNDRYANRSVPSSGNAIPRTNDAIEASRVVGGGIYDAMLAHCALKAQAEAIYSWNSRHYAQCGLEVTGRLRTP